MRDLIDRQAVIDEIDEWIKAFLENGHKESAADACLIQDGIIQLPSAQPTLYGYNIEYLKLIANILQKENLPPERVAEALNDIIRIVEIVSVEFAETLRKAVEQCKI